MNRIFRGRRYDTETATKVAEYYYGNRGDFNHFEEELHRKKTGEYFLYGYGGPLSKYAENFGDGTRTGSEKIIPLSFEEAQEWGEKHLDGDECEKIFGPVDESGEKERILLSLPVGKIEILKRQAAKEGKSISDIVSELIK